MNVNNGVLKGGDLPNTLFNIHQDDQLEEYSTESYERLDGDDIAIFAQC